jgi:hypothetical protein
MTLSTHKELRLLGCWQCADAQHMLPNTQGRPKLLVEREGSAIPSYREIWLHDDKFLHGALHYAGSSLPVALE